MKTPTKRSQSLAHLVSLYARDIADIHPLTHTTVSPHNQKASTHTDKHTKNRRNGVHTCWPPTAFLYESPGHLKSYVPSPVAVYCRR